MLNFSQTLFSFSFSGRLYSSYGFTARLRGTIQATSKGVQVVGCCIGRLDQARSYIVLASSIQFWTTRTKYSWRLFLCLDKGCESKHYPCWQRSLEAAAFWVARFSCGNIERAGCCTRFCSLQKGSTHRAWCQNAACESKSRWIADRRATWPRSFSIRCLCTDALH